MKLRHARGAYVWRPRRITIVGRRITRDERAIEELAEESQQMYEAMLLTLVSSEMQLMWEELVALPSFEALLDVR